jgi:probable phosphoglycerate mutase
LSVRILLLRHAATTWNLEGRIQGRSDVALSAQGRADVQGLSCPPPWRSGRCYSSPLRRARDTARALGALSPQLVPALTEMSWGDWEGQTLAALRSRLGEAMMRNEARGLDFCPPGGESPRQVAARVRRWLASLPADEPVWAVTHKGVIRAVYALASGWDMREKPAARLDFKRGQAFRIDGDVLRVEALNVPLVRQHGDEGPA